MFIIHQLYWSLVLKVTKLIPIPVPVSYLTILFAWKIPFPGTQMVNYIYFRSQSQERLFGVTIGLSSPSGQTLSYYPVISTQHHLNSLSYIFICFLVSLSTHQSASSWRKWKLSVEFNIEFSKQRTVSDIWQTLNKYLQNE